MNLDALNVCALENRAAKQRIPVNRDICIRLVKRGAFESLIADIVKVARTEICEL